MDAVDPDRIGRWSRLAEAATLPLRRLWLNVHVEGASNLPSSGGAIVAANHLSFLDSLLIMHCLPRRSIFLGKAEYLDRWYGRKLFTAAGMIPIDRTAKATLRSLQQAVGHLRDGDVVGVFPEGTRSRDGHLHRGHPGVAHLALRSGAPIVPVGLCGTDEALPPGARLPVYGSDITLRVGAPIDLGRWAGRRTTRTSRREITDRVMERIAELSGQRRVDLPAPIPAHAG